MIRNKGDDRGESQKQFHSISEYGVEYTASCSVYRSVKWTPDDLIV